MPKLQVRKTNCNKHVTYKTHNWGLQIFNARPAFQCNINIIFHQFMPLGLSRQLSKVETHSNSYNILFTPPPPPKPDHIVTRPPRCCPVDCLGYPQRCCGCVPLLIGTIVICVMSFMGAIIELMQSEKLMDIIFHENDDLSIYFKLFYLFKKVQLIQIYVCFACIFNCICVAIKIMLVAVQMFEGSLEKKSLIVILIILSCVVGAFANIQVHIHMTPRPETTSHKKQLSLLARNVLHVARQPDAQSPRQ
ncbi:hypothetical protein SFRURICE_012109 [Spodoptera frugiperda]|nr:hypothetical protein SFRURICE_012109 [Spodoptera frugiperda]